MGDMTHINWYPGHMAKARRQIEADMKLVDLVIELVDARIPLSSKNPDIERLSKGKSKVLLLNKADLADEKITKAWKEYFTAKGYFVALLDSRVNNGMKTVTELVTKACAQKLEKDRKKGITGRPLRAMILGIPNVGKSTFINSYCKKSIAKTGNKPGVTKGKQWIKLSKELELLDTPGILWPKFEDPMVGLRLAETGSINDDILQIEELMYKLSEYIMQEYPGLISKKYQIEEITDTVKLLENLAVKKACMKKGGEPDLTRAANLFTDDFRAGKLGRISLERPEKNE